MQNTITPRFIDIEAVAHKLGYASRNTFTKHRQALEENGFPPPTLTKDQFGTERWDNKAIDLWMDSRIPAGLLIAAKPHNLPDPRIVEQTLQQRARSMML